MVSEFWKVGKVGRYSFFVEVMSFDGLVEVVGFDVGFEKLFLIIFEGKVV